MMRFVATRANVAVKSALLAQFSIPARIPEQMARRAELQATP